MVSSRASLVLSVIVMVTSGVASDVSDVSPLSEALYIFDVVSTAPSSEIETALGNVNARHRFKLVGSNRYLLVVESSAAQTMSLPEDTQVTQYPAEHMDEFLQMFGVNGWDESDTMEQLTDDNLLVVIWDFIIPHTMSASDFDQLMQSFASIYQQDHSEVRPVSYSVVGRYPPKIFFFMNLNNNGVQQAIREGLDAAGGPGNIAVSVQHLANF